MQIRWITQDGVEQLPETRLLEHTTRSDGVLWVHFDHTDEAGMALVAQVMKPRSDDLRDVGNRSPVPKLHPYADHHYSSINGLARGSDGLLHFQPLKVFFAPTMLWTIFGAASNTAKANIAVLPIRPRSRRWRVARRRCCPC